MSKWEWIMFFTGLSLGGFFGWLWTYILIKKPGSFQIQVGGNNSKQTMITNINHNKCNTCEHSKFVESEIATKSLYCSKRGYLCNQIDQCSDYKKE